MRSADGGRGLYGSARLRSKEGVLADREKIRAVAAACREHGVDFFLWHHELVYPPQLRTAYPETFLPNGKPDFSNSTLQRFIREKYDEVFGEVLPDVAGVVITTAECSYAVGHGDKSELQQLMDIVIGAHRDYRKQCIFRTFSYSPEQNATTRSVAATLPRETIVMIKSAPADFFDTFGPDPSVGNVGRHDQMLEFDLHGENRGSSTLPVWTGEYDKRILLYGLERGVRHTVARVGHMGTSIFDNNYGGLNPNEANLATFARLAWDPRADVRKAQLDWVKTAYGAKEAAPLLRALRRTHDIHCKTHYYRNFAISQKGIATFEYPRNPVFIFSWAMELQWTFQYHCWHPDEKTRRILHMLLRPLPQHLNEFRPEKLRALDLLKESIDDLALARQNLPADVYQNLRTYFERYEIFARLCLRQMEIIFLTREGLPLSEKQRRTLKETRDEIADLIPKIQEAQWPHTQNIERVNFLQMEVGNADEALRAESPSPPPARRYDMAPPLSQEAAAKEAEWLKDAMALAQVGEQRPSACSSGENSRGQSVFTTLKTLAAWRQRRAQLRKELRCQLGIDGTGKPLLNARVIWEDHRPDLLRQRIEIHSEDGRTTSFLLLDPAPASPFAVYETRKRAALCLPGRPGGARTVAGLDPAPDNDGYGWGLVRRNYLVVSPDFRGAGSAPDTRPNDVSMDKNPPHPHISILVCDAILCMDWLEQSGKANMDHVGVIGFRWGAAVAMLGAALDERFHTVVQADCPLSWRRDAQSAKDSGPLFSQGEIHAMIAPRPLLLSQSSADGSDVRRIRQIVEIAKQAYGLYGTPERLKVHFHDSKDRFHPEVALNWINRWAG